MNIQTALKGSPILIAVPTLQCSSTNMAATVSCVGTEAGGDPEVRGHFTPCSWESPSSCYGATTQFCAILLHNLISIVAAK